MSQNRLTILDIPIDRISFFEALRHIEELVDSGGPHQVATVNPEFIMHAQKNKDFKQALLESSLNTADGIGIIWASKFLDKKIKKQEHRKFKISQYLNIPISNLFWLKATLVAILFNKRWLSSEIPERVTGIDLMWELANKAQEREWKIGLLSWDKGRARAKEVEEKLKTLYPRLEIACAYDGSPEEEGIVKKIAEIHPDILFVAFGSPKQEIFIHQNLKEFGSKVVIGVGGSFDFIVGRAKRAPKIFRILGLEWLYRFALQPKRAGRIFNAFPRFVWKVYREVDISSWKILYDLKRKSSIK